MCGIFGVQNYETEKFLNLYKINKQRGDFSIGVMCIAENELEFVLAKKKGDMKSFLSEGYRTLLGHTRAPTNTVTEFSFSEAHPVIHNDWVVFHNGIINNYQQLKQKYSIPHELDSYCFPYMFTKYMWKDEVVAIRTALEEVDGIFACAILNTKSRNLYLVRCASSLYYDENGCFSSLPFENSIEAKEGKIYQINNSITTAGEFNYSSPYYIPD